LLQVTSRENNVTNNLKLNIHGIKTKTISIYTHLIVKL